MTTSFPIHIEVTVFENEDALSQDWKSLVEAAKEASFSAYAPYSDYHVGAALLLDSGEIVTGNNQENASYPEGLCAERVAIFHTKSKYPDAKIRKIAVVAQPGTSGQFVPVSPCGGCRQVISETRNRQDNPISILLTGTDSKYYLIADIEDLLPLKFSKTQLSKP